MRNVLMVTYHFPPSSASGSFRLLGFARHLPRHGWRATVVAPPSLPWEPVDDALLEKLPPETTVYHAPYLKNRVVRKAARYSGWLPGAFGVCRKAIREQKPDVLLTSGPPHQIHWLGLLLKKRYGIPWAADFRDPWYPEGRMERGNDFVAWRVGVQEAAVFRAADAVIANAPGACEAIRAGYPMHHSKFVTLPNGYDREAFEGAPPPEPYEGRALRIVHIGAIYVGRDPRPFLDAVRALNQGGRVSLDVDFFGPPPESDLNLPAEVGNRGLASRVKIYGQVPYSRCLREITTADINLLMDSPGRTVGVPAKLYEYLGAGRPILALGEKNGDLAWVLSQSGVPHRIANPSDPHEVTSALDELVREMRSLSDGPPRSDLHRFSREAIAGRLAAVLTRCQARDFDAENDGNVPDHTRDAAITQGMLT